ncbi:MAG: TolC family protein [Bacteriovoracaceae bacterium]|nr:TolC family protein [Bacteriovoracaceae bacterium]
MNRWLICLVLPLAMIGAANASQTYDLSLEQSVSRALNLHEAISLSEADKVISEAKLLSARSGLLPTVTADYSRVNFSKSGALTPADKAFSSGNVEAVDLKVTQPLFTFGKIYRGTQMAKKGVEISEIAIRGTRQQIAFGAKALYYKVLFSQRKFEISSESYNNAKKNQRQLLNRQRFGRSSRVDQVKMEADIAMRVPSLKLAETDYKNNLQSLKEHLRISRADKLKLTQSFADFKVLTAPRINIKAAEAKRPELETIKKAIEISDLKIKNAKASFAPDFAAFAQYNPTRHHEEFDMGDSEWKTTTNLGVGMSFSFGGSKIGDLREAVNTKYKNTYAYTVKRKSYQNELSNLVETYDSLIDVFGAARRSHKLAIEAYKLTESLFKSGNISQAYLNDRELQLTRAKLGVAESLMNIHIVYAQVEQLASLEGSYE